MVKELDTIKQKILRIAGIIEEILNYIILGILVFYVFSLVLSTTTFMLNVPWATIRQVMNYLFVVVILKAVFARDKKLVLLSIVAVIGYYYTYKTCGYSAFAYIALFTVGLTGVHWKKITAAYIIPSSVVLLPMMFASLSGAIHNFTTIGRGTRSSWGNCNSTEFVSAILFLLIFAWVYFKNIPDLFFIIPGLITLILSAGIARGKTATALTALFLAFIVFREFEDRFFNDPEKFKRLKKVTGCIVVLSFPFIFGLMMVMVYLYHKQYPMALRFNDLSHQRLITAAEMYEKYGLKPFGSFFSTAGNGWQNFDIEEYTFIDSSYPLMFIRYGYVTSFMAIAAWMFLAFRVVKAGNKRIAFAMFLLALDCVSEQHFPELNYNILLVMPFAFMDTKDNNRCAALRGLEINPVALKFRIAQLLSLTVLFVIWLIVSPYIFSYYRTIFNGFGLTDGYEVIDGLRVYIICAISVLVFVSFIWFSSKLVSVKVMDGHISLKYLFCVVAFAMVILGGYFAGDFYVNQVSRNVLERMLSGSDLIHRITSVAEGKVYVDRFPESYARQFSGIDRSFLDGEDISRLKDVTLIVNADDDSNLFASEGFLYLQISDEDAIYTNDESVINALKSDGYVLTGYNNKVHDVDFRKMAALHGYRLQEDGSIFLKGVGRSLVYGPYLELYPGVFTVTFDLKLPEDEELPFDISLGSLRVSYNWGKHTLSEVSFSRNMFDENGELSLSIPFSGGGPGYEFLVFMNEDYGIFLKGITYSRTPQYDRHIKVNAINQVVHEEYYDFQGKPYMLPAGYCGAEYEYDDDDNSIMTRYLGADGKATLISSGYAELHRTFDENKLVISESYYGVAGEPMILNDSYFKVDKTYNSIRQLISEKYYGTDNKPILVNQGYARIDREYDEDGNADVLAYFGKEDEPVIMSSGYHKVEKIFNENKLVTKENYYGTDEKPIYSTSGIAALERIYDADKRVISEWYFDVNEEPCCNTAGIHKVEYLRDKAGRNLLETYYGPEDSPIANTSGYFGIKRDYDEKGNNTVITYVDASGEPVLNTGRTAIVKREFDDKNRLIKETYLDAYGNVALNTSEVAGCKYTYNERNLAVKYTYLDERGFMKENSSGYAILKREYDDYNRQIRDIYCDRRGNVIASSNATSGIYRTYDDFNRIDTLVYIDPDGDEILNTSGYAQIKYVYDDNFYNAEEYYFDVKGNSVLNTNLCAGIKRQQSKRLITHEEYVDTAGNLTAIGNGTFGQNREYDKLGNLIKIIYLDDKGNPMLNTSGYAITVREYDAARNCTAEYFYDEQGNPKNNTSGVYKIHRVYDRDRNVTETTRFDVDGNQI